MGLLKYVGKSEERLLNTARQTLIGPVEMTDTDDEYKIRRKNEHKTIWKDKAWSIFETKEEEGEKERWLWLSGTAAWGLRGRRNR